MAQATGTDFAAYGRMAEAEQDALAQALAAIPDDILSTGDRQWIETRIRNRLQREGFLPASEGGGLIQVEEIPAIAYAGRAVACLAANSANLRGISHNKPAAAVAESIAQTVSACVAGGTDAITADILAHRTQVADALTAIRLDGLASALLATWGDKT